MLKNILPLSICFMVLIALFSFKTTPKPSAEIKALKKKLPDLYVFIPEGNSVVDKDTLHFDAFFMTSTEITNFHYLEYLYSLKKNNETERYKAALPDTANWTKQYKLSKMAAHYFNHPAYRDYPAVNITQEQAIGYCSWLQNVLRNYTGNKEIIVRLPFRKEFIRAANGNTLKRRFSWTGYDIRKKDGVILCNHLNLSNINIAKDAETGQYMVDASLRLSDNVSGDNSDLTAPVASYFKSDLGLYNLNGNVSEWVQEKDMAVGGDWSMPGYNVQNTSYKINKTSDPSIGFRVLIELPKTK